jgi:tetratricopeptide (TPR) repeat protein
MTTRAQSAWLFGPLPDLLFGAGLLYLLLLGGLTLGGVSTPTFLPAGTLVWLILIISSAHYGGTLLRVYEDPQERRTYRRYTLHATLLILAVLIASLHSPITGSLMITVYLTWSPWHYTGQNYGIAMMFLRRRGVAIGPAAKRWLYASFVLSYLSVLLNFHFEGGIGQPDPLGYTASLSSGYRFLSLSLPGLVRSLVFPLVAVGYLVSIAASGFLLVRAAGPKAIAPASLVVLTQATWFSIPHIGFYTGLPEIIPTLDLRGEGSLPAFVMWAALGHAIQYLWITSYYARREQRWTGYASYFTKTLLFGAAVWAAPVALFGPESIGRPEYDGGLALCVAAAVNIQHFIVDGAIWKSRNPKVAATLLRARQISDIPSAPSTASSWTRRIAWAVALLFCILKLAPEIDLNQRLTRVLQTRDYEAAEAILDRAALFGRDSSRLRLQLGHQLASEMDPAAALRHYWRSLELQPRADVYLNVGNLIESRSKTESALYAWTLGQELFPNDFALNRRIGSALVLLRREAEALPYLERAHALRPDDVQTSRALEMARERGPKS